MAQCEIDLCCYVCYQYGKGTSKDEEKVFIWYRKSAEAGNVTAQNQLAYCYGAGFGISMDVSMWLKLLNGSWNLQ